MKEVELKTDILGGGIAPLLIGGVLLWAFVLRPNTKKAGKAGKAGNNGPPPTNGAGPAVEIMGVGFEGSPAETFVTKGPGEAFTAEIILNNPTVAAWNYEVSLRFGYLGIWPAWTTDETMPILMGSVTAAAGGTGGILLPHVVPQYAKPKTYDIRVEVQVAGKGIEGGVADYKKRFTVPEPIAAAAVRILELSWV